MEKNLASVGAAETGESFTRGRIRKRERWDSQRSFTPYGLTLGAISMGVKQYNGWIATKVGQRQIRVVGHRAVPEAAAGLSAEEGGEEPDVGGVGVGLFALPMR